MIISCAVFFEFLKGIFIEILKNFVVREYDNILQMSEYEEEKNICREKPDKRGKGEKKITNLVYMYSRLARQYSVREGERAFDRGGRQKCKKKKYTVKEKKNTRNGAKKNKGEKTARQKRSLFLEWGTIDSARGRWKLAEKWSGSETRGRKVGVIE